MDFMARQAQTPWLEFSLQGAHSGEVSDTHQWPYLRNFRSRSSRSSRSSSSCCSRAAVRSTACAPLSPLTCLLRAFTEPGGLTLGERCGERSRLRGGGSRDGGSRDGGSRDGGDGGSRTFPLFPASAPAPFPPFARLAAAFSAAALAAAFALSAILALARAAFSVAALVAALSAASSAACSLITC